MSWMAFLLLQCFSYADMIHFKIVFEGFSVYQISAKKKTNTQKTLTKMGGTKSDGETLKTFPTVLDKLSMKHLGILNSFLCLR